ncbi:hypothetical protein [Bifidobacterium apri]
MEITIAIEYKRSRTWGYIPHATVRATVRNKDNCVIARDMSTGSASGCGYDKTSAATCYAFDDNKVLQTFALWKDFKPTEYAHARDYGYEYAFDGCGMSALTGLMRANRFEKHEIWDKDGDITAIVYTRDDLPESFTKLV